jgi:hypothetical protein
MTRRPTIVLALLGVLLAILAGCSRGGAADQPPPQGEPTVSTPADETPAPSPMSDDFATAVKFTKLVYQSEYKKANALVVPESPAARYLVAQVSIDKAQRIAGYDPSDNEKPDSIKPDPTTGNIKVKFAKTEDEPATSYVWKDFTYDQGKITGWTGKSGPINDRLWTRTTTDSKLGARAKLESAYLSSSGTLFIVVEVSAKRDVDLGYMPSYAAKSGYRQSASDSSGDELAKGEKTLVYCTFDDAKFGGKLRLKIASASGYDTANLELAIK